MGGDELAVVEWGLTRSERQLVVIEALPYAFVRTDGDHRAAGIAQLLQGKQPLVICDHGPLQQDPVQRTRAGMVPQRRTWRFVQPQRIDRKSTRLNSSH